MHPSQTHSKSAAPAASLSAQWNPPEDPLITAIRLLVRQEVAAATSIQAASPGSSFPKPSKVWLSIHDIQVHYGIGRKAICQMIKSGKLPAKEERCRGGKNGQFVHITDAEKALMRRDSHD